MQVLHIESLTSNEQVSHDAICVPDSKNSTGATDSKDSTGATDSTGVTDSTDAKYMFNKILLWGDKLFENNIPLNLDDEHKYELSNKRGTFSYIYYGFYKAFVKLNYDVYWLDHDDNIDNFDFSNTLIIAYNNTININIYKFPINNKCYYLLHNVYYESYFKDIFKNVPLNHIIHYILPMDKSIFNLDYSDNIYYINRFNKGKYIKDIGYILINLWATDLLPEEIKEINKDLLNNLDITKNEAFRENKYYFVGTLNHNDAMQEFVSKNKIKLEISGGSDRINGNNTILQNIELVRKSNLSLALQASIQIDLEYISCRIFKSISYGRMPICNNKIICELISNEIIYDNNYENLYKKGIKFEENPDKINIMIKLINNIIDNHTFISRAETIINYFLKIHNNTEA